MFLVNKVKSFLGGREKLGEKRQRKSYEDDVEVPDCLQTPPSKRAKCVQRNKGVSSSSSPLLQRVNEGLLQFKRWSDKYLWKYVVSGETEPDEGQEHILTSNPSCDTDMDSQFKQPSHPSTYNSSVIKRKVHTTNVTYKQRTQEPAEKGAADRDWRQSYWSFSTPSVQTSTPLPHKPMWDIDKLEKTFQAKDQGPHHGKKYDANKYKDTGKDFSWKPSSQLSFTVGQYSQNPSLLTSSRTGGKVRVGHLRSGLERLKRSGSSRRYKTTAEEAVRLAERDRYRQLVAQHTNVESTMYDFSKSTAIPPQNSPFVAAVKERKQKPTAISRVLSGSLLSPQTSLLPPSISVKPYTCPTSPKLTSVVKVVASPRKRQDEVTAHVQDIELFSNSGPFEVSKVSERSYKARSIFSEKQPDPAFESDWVKKWKEVLSPESLAREREKAKEERKLAELKAKEQDELKAVEDKVKERIRRQEAGLPDEEPEGLLEEVEEEGFPVLTDEMEQEVDKALAPGNPDDPLVDGFRITLKRGDVATLANLNWLNDEVINFYFSLLVARSEEMKGIKVYAFNSFFYPKLIKTGYATLRRWTKKVDIFAMDIVFVPVHLGMHWCLAAIDFRKKTITYYDSLKGSNHQCLNALRSYLQEESKDKKKQPFDLSDWTNSCPKDIPEQLNGCDCGVFTCKYGDYLSRDAPLTFTQHDMPYFRRRMIYEMLNKKLM